MKKGAKIALVIACVVVAILIVGVGLYFSGYMGFEDGKLKFHFDKKLDNPGDSDDPWMPEDPPVTPEPDPVETKYTIHLVLPGNELKDYEYTATAGGRFIPRAQNEWIANQEKEGKLYRFDDWYTDEAFTTKMKTSELKDGDTVYAKMIEQFEIIINNIYPNSEGQEIKRVDKDTDFKLADNLDSTIAESIGVYEDKGKTIVAKDFKVSSNKNIYAYWSTKYSEFNLTANKEISKFKGSSTTVIIPNSITKILDEAFKGCAKIQSIIIGNGVTHIGKYAFHNCTNLKSITIGKSVSTMGENVLGHCSNLTTITVDSSNTEYYSSGNCVIYKENHQVTVGCKNSIIPSDGSVEAIAYDAFQNCTTLTSITIPDSVTSIASSAFDGCSGLTTITPSKAMIEKNYESSSLLSTYFPSVKEQITKIIIPDSATSIGECVFYGCSKLTSVIIGNDVTSIGSSAFYNCTALTSITIGNNVTTIEGTVFIGCPNLKTITPNKKMIEKDYVTREGDPNGTLLSTYFSSLKNQITTVIIPSGVTKIGKNAFKGCSKLTSVTIGKDVTTIETSAFSGCSGLENVTIGNGVTSIGDYAFNGCSKLTSVTIPDKVTSVGTNAFSNCSGLKSITIGEGIGADKIVEQDVFSGCSGLTTVTLNNNMLERDYIEKDRDLLFTYFPSSADKITTVIIPDGVTSIGIGAFKNRSKLTSVTIGNKVTSIGEEAFYGCTGLTSITIPDSVKSIGSRAFKNCSGLTNVTIGNGVTSIGQEAFYACNALTNVTIGNGVTSIGQEAFYACNALTNVTIYAKKAPTLGGGVFQECHSDMKIYVPSENQENYKRSTGEWQDYFGKLQPIQK